MKNRVKIIGFVFGFVAIAIFAAIPSLKRHSAAVNCSNQMHVVLFAATLLWPENHGGHLPSDFLSMSNELTTPKFLVCPEDRKHQPALSWATFTTNNCSYEIIAPGILKNDTNRIFLRCTIHGYVGYSNDRLLDASGTPAKPNRLW
jgi:hypothetical protein